MLRARRSLLDGGFLRHRGSESTSSSQIAGSTNHFGGLGDFLHFLSGLPRHHSIAEDQWSTLHRSTLYHAHRLSPEGVAKVLNLLAAHKHNDRKTVSRLVEKMLDSRFVGYSARDISLALNSLVRLSSVDREIFMVASKYLQSLPLTEFVSEKDIGLICNAYARAGILDDSLFANLTARAESQLSSMSSQTCGNICHAFGKLGFKSTDSDSLVIKIVDRTISTLSKRVSPQELSNILYSLGNLRINASDAIEPLLGLMVSKIKQMNPIELAAVATALTKLNVPHKQILKNIAQTTERKCADVNSYEITAVLHAFSQLDVAIPTKLFSETAPVVYDRSTEINSQTACIAFCSYGRVGIRPPSSIAASVLGEKSAQHLVHVLFAFSRLAVHNEEPWKSVLSHTISVLLEKGVPLSPANLNQVIFALNKLASTDAVYSDAALLYANVIEVTTSVVPQLEGQHVANILHAISQRDSSHPPSPAEDILVRKLALQLTNTDMSPQLFASGVESISRLGIKLGKIWTAIESRLKFSVPLNSADDVRVLEALATVGRLKGEVVQVLLRRIAIERLDISTLRRMVQAVTNGDIGKEMGENLTRDVAEYALSHIEDLSGEDLVFFAKSLGEMSLEPQFPFSLFNEGTTYDTNGSALTMIAFKVDDEVSAHSDDKPEFILHRIEEGLAAGYPRSVLELYHLHLASALPLLGTRSEVDYNLLAQCIHRIPQEYHSRIAEGVGSMFGSVDGSCVPLILPKVLLDSSSTDLRNTVIERIIPAYIASDRACDVQELLRHLAAGK